MLEIKVILLITSSMLCSFFFGFWLRGIKEDN